ncbi:hypothetical protein AAHC03_018964 [Spirometra sp. Aus1]
MQSLLVLLTISALYRGSLACGAMNTTTESSPGRPTPIAPYRSGPRPIECPRYQPLHGAKRTMTEEEMAAPVFKDVVNKSLIDLKNQSGGCFEYDLVEVKEATKQIVADTRYEWKMTVRPRPISSDSQCPVSVCDSMTADCKTEQEFKTSAWVRPWEKDGKTHQFTHRRTDA